MEYITKTYEYANGTTRVHIPILTEGERKVREKELKMAAEHFMKHVERVRANE